MVLEQWEIDLRKQLEGTTAKPSRVKNWEDILREEINDVSLPEKPLHKIHQKSSRNLRLISFTSIFFLFFVLVFIFDCKTGKISQIFNKKSTPTAPTDDFASQVKGLRFDIDKMRAENQMAFENLSKKVKWNGDRIVLLGMVNNENLSVLHNQGATSKQFLYFDKDWSLNAAPQYLDLTEEDRQFLQKYVKK